VQRLAVVVVVCIAVGQLLFKMSAQHASQEGGLLAPKPALILLCALALYAASTLAWVWMLQKTELGRIYPVMALSFVLVPAGSHFLFGESFTARYCMGVALIVVGILLTVRA